MELGEVPPSSRSAGLRRGTDHGLTGVRENGIITFMSAQEIIAELARLHPDELRLVRERLSELESAPSPTAPSGWGRALNEIVAKADDLPADISLQHDHYLYGSAKR